MADSSIFLLYNKIIKLILKGNLQKKEYYNQEKEIIIENINNIIEIIKLDLGKIIILIRIFYFSLDPFAEVDLIKEFNHNLTLNSNK